MWTLASDMLGNPLRAALSPVASLENPYLFVVTELRADSLAVTKIFYGSFISAWQKCQQEM